MTLAHEVYREQMESDWGATEALDELVTVPLAPTVSDPMIQDPFKQSTVDDFDLVRPSLNPEGSKLKLKQNTNEDTDYDSDPLDDDILSQPDVHPLDIFYDECMPLDNLENNRNLLVLEVADSDAFSDAFIKRRQWVIDNQAYRAIINSWTKVKTMQQLVTSIKKHTHRKPLLDRAWFVFYWMVTNIAFDPVSWISGKRVNQLPNTVFQARKGVSADYARLFKRLCTLIGMQCECVSGFTKVHALKCQKETTVHCDHIWNIICIDQHWYLIDTTWASGYLTDNKTKFERNLDVHYFLARPDEFIYSHLPKNQKLQQLKKPISMLQYAQMPNIYPAYFRFGLELFTPHLQENVTFIPGKPFAMISIRAPSDIDLSACLMLDDRKMIGGHYIAYSTEMNLYHCYFAPSSVGTHKIVVYGRRKNEIEYVSAIELNYDVIHLPDGLISFPKLWHAFFKHNIKIVYPRNTHAIQLDSLTQNHSQVLIQAPTNLELQGRLMNSRGIEVQGGTRVYFDRRNGLWRCKFAPDQTGTYEACILARSRLESDDITNFSPVAAFELQVNYLDSPISYPTLFQRFYDLDLRLISPTSQNRLTYKDNSHFVRICVRSPANVQLICHTEYIGQKLKDASLSQFNADKQYWELLFAPQCAALQHLLISARSDDVPFQLVAQFDLHVPRFLRPMILPLVYPRFYAARCYIQEPLEGILTVGTNVRFRYYLPGAMKVFVEVDSQRDKSHQLVGSLFEQFVMVGRNKVTVFVQYDKYYEPLVKYLVK